MELKSFGNLANDIMSELDIKNKMIAEEREAKYAAWRRIAELQQEILELKALLNATED